MDFAIFQQLGVAVALASLIGLEREHRNQLNNSQNFGGVRTFTLIGLFGALSYVFSRYVPALFLIFTIGFLVLIIVAYVITNRYEKNHGLTSEIASILVYMTGVLSAMEQYLMATVVAIIILVVLYFKDPLHKWAKQLKKREIISTLQFIIITFVILPLLPNEAYGPYGFFNPNLIWLMVVFISGISFLSYIAIKVLGPKKGIGLSGFLAGFISSTALAFSFSGDSKKNPQIVNPYVVAMTVAASAMFIRVLIEVRVLNGELMAMLLLPMSLMALTGMVCAAFIWLKKEPSVDLMEENILKMESPFSLWPALKFGVLFAGIMLLTEFMSETMGSQGIYLTSMISGLLDVDAITISLSNMAGDHISNETASRAIALAAIVNTFSKAGIFLLFANRKVAVKIAAVFGLMIVVGVVAMFLL
ncbi:MAG: MgtC/SapB family protein [Patescibacteria group bacterium]